MRMIASKDYFAKIEMLKALPLAHARIMMNPKDKQELLSSITSRNTGIPLKSSKLFHPRIIYGV